MSYQNTKSSEAATDNSLIKINGISSVYYLDSYNLRHAFPSESVFFSWYDNFDGVKTISSTELQSYQLSTNVTMRPGTKLIKITTDPSVYAVEPGGVLRRIPSESEASSIYGPAWNTKVVDISDAFFTNYTIGTPLASSTPPAGTLVKSADTKYFYFDGNKYRQITSAETFRANHFKSENIISLNTSINPTVIGSSITSSENILSDIHAINVAASAVTNSSNSLTNNSAVNNIGAGTVSYGGGGGSSSGASSSNGGGGGSINAPISSPNPVTTATSSTSTIVVSPATSTPPVVTDTVKPVITHFLISTSSTSLTIPISSLTASDNIAVTAYLLTETSAAPSASSSTWSTLAPATYSFFSAGAKTIYAWAKDAAGNVSNSLSASITITSAQAPTNVFYISPSGSDASGNGTAAFPWKTLYKACNSVTTSGSTIHVNAGTYIETQSCNLAVGVSIEGEGVTSIIKSHYTTPNTLTMNSAAISLVSSASGTTNGKQSISKIKLDGDNLQGSAGILVKKRSNVKVHDITIVDFFKNGIAFWGPSAFDSSNGPFLYDDGNELYNSIITNCGDIPGDNVTFSGGALILITAQSNLLIHDNTLSEISRAQGHNGNIMNAGGRHFKGVKYYNNKSYKPDDEGAQMNADGVPQSLPTGWNFHLEIWNNEGGFEIYNNEFYGGDTAIDCAGHDSGIGSYDYSWSIHDNLFTPLNGASAPRNSYRGKSWIVIEAKYTYKTLIYNNQFEYGTTGISMWPLVAEDVLIYDNIFRHALYLFSSRAYEGGQYGALVADFKRISFYRNVATLSNTSGYFYGAIKITATGSSKISDVNIYNNTIVADNIIHMAGVDITAGSTSGNTPISGGTLNNINIKNNIMAYFTNQGPIRIINNGVINGLHIENNLSYNLNNVSIAPYFWPYNIGTLSSYTNLNNMPTSNTTQLNPLFVSASNFQLQPGSPAINNGIDVGLPYNGSAPDMGAFETQ